MLAWEGEQGLVSIAQAVRVLVCKQMAFETA